jgi:hypothetical protein
MRMMSNSVMRSSGSPWGAFQQRTGDLLDTVRSSLSFPQVAQYHDRKLQAFGLVNGQEWDAPFREGIFGVFQLGLPQAVKGEKVGAEDDLQGLLDQKVGSDEGYALPRNAPGTV